MARAASAWEGGKLIGKDCVDGGIVTKHRDIVILLPGITGSVLTDKHGKEIWAPSAGAIWRAVRSGGESIRSLALANEDAVDGVRATRLIDDVTILPGLVKIDGYSGIRSFLTTHMALVEDENFFTFPYDWRLDNRINARLLQTWAMDRLNRWRAQSGAQDAKLTLIAHSMGGLVARYFLECLGGWMETRFLFTIATPHRGSLNAVDFLCNGMKRGIGPVGIDLSPLLRSYTSVYQLLPTYPCIGAEDTELRYVAQAAQEGLLPQVEHWRAVSAKKFHEEIRFQQECNARDDAYRENGYRLVPIVGTDQPTTQSATVSESAVTLLRSRMGEDEAGDGTVPRGSATPLELERDFREHYVAEKHGALQNSPAVLDTLKGILTRSDFKKMRGGEHVLLILDVDDAIIAPEPLTVRVQPVGARPSVKVLLESLSSGEQLQATLARQPDGWQEGTFALAPGIWRISASAHLATDVHDLIIVAEK